MCPLKQRVHIYSAWADAALPIKGALMSLTVQLDDRLIRGSVDYFFEQCTAQDLGLKFSFKLYEQRLKSHLNKTQLLLFFKFAILVPFQKNAKKMNDSNVISIMGCYNDRTLPLQTCFSP